MLKRLYLLFSPLALSFFLSFLFPLLFFLLLFLVFLFLLLFFLFSVLLSGRLSISCCLKHKTIIFRSTFRVHSHLRFIRREFFSPLDRKKRVHNTLLNFSVQAKVDQIASVNAPTYHSTINYLVNSKFSTFISKQFMRWFTPNKSQV